MPITVRPSANRVGRLTQNPSDPSQFLRLLDEWKGREPKDHTIFRSFFDAPDKDEPLRIIPHLNGFVHGIVQAFKQDLHLVLRPDDVWLSIITQLSFYVNKNAEGLRSKIVKHDGQVEISIEEFDARFKWLQGGALARQLTNHIRDQLAGSSMLEWMIPDFTTSTNADKSICHMVALATTQQYFTKYECSYKCGFPSVTLLGERRDWALMRKLVNELPHYGEEAAAWQKLLVPILNHFVMTFDHPDQKDVNKFWLSVCLEEAGEGIDNHNTYAGWITAFAYWDSSGNRIVEDARNTDGKLVYKLEGKAYPRVAPEHIPAGVVEFPLLMKFKSEGVQRSLTVVAGSVGLTVAEKEEEDMLRGPQVVQFVQPRPGWWFLLDKEGPLSEETPLTEESPMSEETKL
ncbi:hypothetical protein K491DRAFT_703992 [Lophiostoma macrostomum CBS 122681]|uniref:DUF4419 domain-containing protein n=1 Tax=Lophiostoma macrostomum CBS 122681 TaxID=1314788 RepID=A0A6A6TD35_9PLEO|nr:hypothetical protein K491DRAFT_703992 [Lophiostoma macrostomum CBS 122681]